MRRSADFWSLCKISSCSLPCSPLSATMQNLGGSFLHGKTEQRVIRVSTRGGNWGVNKHLVLEAAKVQKHHFSHWNISYVFICCFSSGTQQFFYAWRNGAHWRDLQEWCSLHYHYFGEGGGNEQVNVIRGFMAANNKRKILLDSNDMQLPPEGLRYNLSSEFPLGNLVSCHLENSFYDLNHETLVFPLFVPRRFRCLLSK